MAAGFRDLLAWLFGWRSSRTFVQAGGPYDVEAACAFSAGAALAAVEHTGAAAATVSLTGETVGEAGLTGSIIGTISGSNVFHQ